MKTITSLFIALLFNSFLFLDGCDKSESEVQANYVLNDTSVAEWKGSSPAVFHEGDFAVTSQNLRVVNDKIKSGTFTIPIASIRNFDLPDEVKPILLNHLKSADFFNMALYPNASFTISRVTPYNGKAENAIAGANYTVTGNFTMLNKTNTISFPAKINISNGKLSAEANLTLDRTQWGMTYAADPALGEHHILPEVAIHLKLAGQKI
jgi:polyisoprenoid-binding protein YceI